MEKFLLKDRYIFWKNLGADPVTEDDKKYLPKDEF